MSGFRFFRVSTLFACLLFFAQASRAQAPQLPDVIGTAQQGLTFFAWTAQFDGIKSIAVQRSSDSIYNFTTIGYVKNIKKGPQGYIDGHPAPGANYYRLYIAFSSDLTWYSNRIKIVVDSAQILAAGVVPPNDSLQRYVGKTNTALASAKMDTSTGTITSPIRIGTVTPPAPEIPVSPYVFTNPFTGHINVEVPEVRAHQYTLRFFNAQNRLVFEVGRVAESPIVIDKRNFQRKGLFRFELLRDKQAWEKGFVTVF